MLFPIGMLLPNKEKYLLYKCVVPVKKNSTRVAGAQLFVVTSVFKRIAPQAENKSSSNY